MRKSGFSALVFVIAVMAAWSAHAQLGTPQIIIGDRINPGAYGRITHANEQVVNCTNCGAASVDVVNVFHQSTIAHISSVTHIVGSMYLTNRAGTAVTVTGTSLDVNCTGCSAASVVNVAHIAAVQHVVIVDWQRWAHIQVSQSGSLTIQAAHQGGNWNVAHVTSVSHIRGTVFIGDKSDFTRNANVTHAGALAVHIASFGVNNGNPAYCHSVASFVVHAGTNVAPVIHVGGGMRVAICSVLVVSSVANDISIVEGNDANGDQNNQSVWSGGCGARAGASAGSWSPLIGGSSRGIPAAANGGWSSISSVPWLMTQTRGNSVCVVKQQGGGHASGTITYGGFQ